MRRGRYDFFESPRTSTSPVASSRTNPNMVLDTHAEDVDVEPKEEPPIYDVPTPETVHSLRLQAPASPVPIEVATPTIAVPQESPVVPKIFVAPAPKQAVPLAKDPSLPKTSTIFAFQNTSFLDPALSSAPDELPDLFDGRYSNDDDHHDDQQEAQLALVADDPPRSHRMPGLGPSLPVTASQPAAADQATGRPFCLALPVPAGRAP